MNGALAKHPNHPVRASRNPHPNWSPTQPPTHLAHCGVAASGRHCSPTRKKGNGLGRP
ncbi:uncharacterized protein BDV17DRAFT_258605 [Aspergillus undulatus]|uniref:uncharacterized protein n=1 Tax=Aspergillus undulatus TaxID=1810928 RepID=UPI003CCDD8C9